MWLVLAAGERAVPFIIGMLGDHSAQVREWTVRTLVTYDDPQARAALLRQAVESVDLEDLNNAIGFLSELMDLMLDPEASP